MTATLEAPRRRPGTAEAISVRVGRRIGIAAAEIMIAHVRELKRFPRLPRAFTIRPAEPSDEPALAAFTGEPAKTARLLSSGDLGLIAVSDERIHAMEWVRLGPARYDWDVRGLGLVFEIPPRHCWLHNGSSGSVGPWGMVLGRLPDLLEQHGIETACLQVASDNQYSIQCHESIGFRRAGRVAMLRIRERPLVWLQSNGTWSLRFTEVTIDLDRLAR